MINASVTPVLLVAYNRPSLTSQVFEQIRQVRPHQLFFAVDGPRQDVSEDLQLTHQTRQVIEKVNWPCEVKTLFHERNHGCREAMIAAIDWFYKHVEAGIILEDDCLPHKSFFLFCTEMLEYYKNDKKIFMISGNNFSESFLRKKSRYSYDFSIYPLIWGWATWKRAWINNNKMMDSWSKLQRTSWLKDILIDDDAVRWWNKIFDSSYLGELDTWDIIWTFSCWENNGLTIVPEVNLVTNIGFGESATHTMSTSCYKANLPINAVEFPLNHPPIIQNNKYKDRFIYDYVICRDGLNREQVLKLLSDSKLRFRLLKYLTKFSKKIKFKLKEKSRYFLNLNRD